MTKIHPNNGTSHTVSAQDKDKPKADKSKTKSQDTQQDVQTDTYCPSHQLFAMAEGGTGGTGGTGGNGAPTGLYNPGKQSSTTTQGGATGASGGPDKVMDLSGFNLQLPTAGENGKAKIVKNLPGGNSQQDRATTGGLSGEDSKYFQQDNGKLTFTAPGQGGATTANSSQARSELAQKQGWDLSSGPHSLSGTVSVDTGGDVTFAQLHQRKADGSKPRPPVMLVRKNNQVVASVLESNDPSAKRKEIVVADNIPNGSKFSYDMQTSPDGNVQISVNGQKGQPIALDQSFKADQVYFKAGAYQQGKDGQDTQVSYYGLNIQ